MDTSRTLADLIPDEFVKVSESGIADATAIQELQTHGYQGFLVGENFMKTEDPGTAAREFINHLERWDSKFVECGKKKILKL